MITIGRMNLYLINDADTRVDPGGPFGLVPRALYHRYYEPDSDFLVPMTTTCLLIQTENRNILVDTGLGTKMSEKQQANWNLSRPNGDVIDALSRIGLKPDDITLVINTHLHADHCSGNTRFAEDGVEIVPTFPNAEYIVQRREYEDAMHPNERTVGTYYAANWQVLTQSGQMRLLDGDIEIVPDIWCVVTPGHTPGHMSVRIESQGHHALFTCDLSSYAVHFEKLGWMTAYDVEPLVTLETKRRWQQWALDTNALLIFPHDSKRPAGHLVQDEKGRPQLVPIIEPFA